MILRLQMGAVVLLLVASGSPLTAVEQLSSNQSIQTVAAEPGLTPIETSLPTTATHWTQAMQTALAQPSQTRGIASGWLTFLVAVVGICVLGVWVTGLVRRHNGVQIHTPPASTLWVPRRK